MHTKKQKNKRTNEHKSSDGPKKENRELNVFYVRCSQKKRGLFLWASTKI